METVTLWMLFLFLPWMTGAVPAHTHHTQTVGTKDDVSLVLKPHIDYCRSPNMETFTCWWSSPGRAALSNGNISYTLTYTVGNGPIKDCPDYETAGPSSCYFDSDHTQVWEMYCMRVTAESAGDTQTSDEYCLDVADIVETDPPFNLSYSLLPSSEEASSSVLVCWQYPITVDVEMGWVTLIYELHFRRASEPNNWKVKGGLREPELELLDLPAGNYVVRVRCKSRNAGLWSKWSSSLTISIPPREDSFDKMLPVILVTGVALMMFLVIGFWVLPQSKRFKAFLLPPIPKPRIRGIDPTLLKNGKIDEINRMFSSFQGYMAPQYSEEVLLQVSMDDGPSNSKSEKEVESTASANPTGNQQHLLHTQYIQGPITYWQGIPAGNEESATPVTLTNGVVPNPFLLPTATQDFYTCVNVVSSRGAVHLVPCVPAEKREAASKEAEKAGEQRDCTMSTAGNVNVGSYTTLDDLRLQ